MVMPAMRLFPAMTVIEQVHAKPGVMAPSAKKTPVVVAVVVLDSVALAGMAVGSGRLGVCLGAHRASSPMRIIRPILELCSPPQPLPSRFIPLEKVAKCALLGEKALTSISPRATALLTASTAILQDHAGKKNRLFSMRQ